MSYSGTGLMRSFPKYSRKTNSDLSGLSNKITYMTSPLQSPYKCKKPVPVYFRREHKLNRSNSTLMNSRKGKKRSVLSDSKELLRKIEEQCEGETMNSNKLKLCQQNLDRLIMTDPKYSCLLSKIKAIYDNYILYQHKEILNRDAKIQEITKTLQEERKLFQKIQKQIVKVPSETNNIENDIKEIKQILCEGLIKNDAETKIEAVKEKAKKKLAHAYLKYEKVKNNNFMLKNMINNLRNKGFPVDSKISNDNKTSKNGLWIEVPSYHSSLSEMYNPHEGDKRSYTLDLSPIDVEKTVS